MPICFLEAPAGIRAEAKKKMVEEITSAINEAYHIPDVRIFLREYSAENVSQDGHLRSEAVRPVFSLNVPRLGSTDAKRAMIQKINAAIAEGYRGLTNAREIMVFLNEYPLENVGWLVASNRTDRRSSQPWRLSPLPLDLGCPRMPRGHSSQKARAAADPRRFVP